MTLSYNTVMLSGTSHPAPEPAVSTTTVPLSEAVAARVEERGTGRTVVTTEVHPGWDVFTIPHGGYLAALAGSAVLAATEQPDIFTITTHFLRKASEGPLRFEVDHVGGSRRFTSVHARGLQGGEVVLSVLASVGDRTQLAGPDWRRAEPWVPDEDHLLAPAGDGPVAVRPPGDGEPFRPPNVARRFELQPDVPSFAFAAGEVTGDATLRARVTVGEPDQLAALVACDVTPPAVWNALGAEGWVPTIELTAHVRTRPAPGPLTVVASTDHVTDGFLDEDALVHDSEGRLVVQSRQLARWTGA